MAKLKSVVNIRALTTQMGSMKTRTLLQKAMALIAEVHDIEPIVAYCGLMQWRLSDELGLPSPPTVCIEVYGCVPRNRKELRAMQDAFKHCEENSYASNSTLEIGFCTSVATLTTHSGKKRKRWVEDEQCKDASIMLGLVAARLLNTLPRDEIIKRSSVMGPWFERILGQLETENGLA